MYSFSSTSQIFEPSARATKNGSPSTLRNARTGEFTPPGISFCATRNNSEEREFKGSKRPTSNAQRPTPNSQAFDRLRERVNLTALCKRRGSQVVRLRSAKP